MSIVSIFKHEQLVLLQKIVHALATNQPSKKIQHTTIDWEGLCDLF